MPSLKSEHCLFGESLRECDFHMAANFDDSIASVVDHPMRIDYLDGGRARHYTPDALVRRVDPKRPVEIIEIKTGDRLQKDAAKFERPFAAARDYAHARGMTFRVLTEAEMPRPLVTNESPRVS